MKKKRVAAFLCTAGMAALFCIPAYAANGNVAGAIEAIWKEASQQFKSVVDNVVFLIIDFILAVFLCIKLATAFFDYRKHGQF